MLLLMVSILTFVRVAQRTQRLLFKIETKFLTKHNAELFQYCRIVRSSLTFPNTYFTDREYFESWCIHWKSGCEVGQMDLLDGSLRALSVCSWPHRKIVDRVAGCSRTGRRASRHRVTKTSKLDARTTTLRVQRTPNWPGWREATWRRDRVEHVVTRA